MISTFRYEWSTRASKILHTEKGIFGLHADVNARTGTERGVRWITLCPNPVSAVAQGTV